MIKIFHTADVHIGLKFTSHLSVQKELIEARFSTLEKMIIFANEEKCDLFIIAGDLFDRTTVSVKDIVRTAEIINLFEGKLVIILPGNHDYISFGQKDLWSRFQEETADNVLILEKPEPYNLTNYDIDVMVYAAPCNSKHSSENKISYIEDVIQESKAKHPNLLHIGLAHGSLEGVSPDFPDEKNKKKYFPMTKKELKRCDLDVWFLGHTHISYPDVVEHSDNIFYSGTPEPDGFDCKHEGLAWMYHLFKEENIIRKKNTSDLKISFNIDAKKISLGTYRFEEIQVEVKNENDLKDLLTIFSDEDKKKILLKLTLSGYLTVSEKQSLEIYRKQLEKKYLFLKWDSSQIVNKIEMNEIEKEFVEGSFSYRLLKELFAFDSKDALQIAYDLLKEAKK